MAAQRVIKEKAAAAKERGEAFKQKQHAKASTAAPAYTMQVLSSLCRPVYVTSLSCSTAHVLMHPVEPCMFMGSLTSHELMLTVPNSALHIMQAGHDSPSRLLATTLRAIFAGMT